MIEILQKSRENVFAMRVHGKLLRDDYKQLVPKLEEAIAEHGALKCYVELTDFEGFTTGALWEEMKFDVKHCRQVERCAVVGNSHAMKWWTQVSDKLFPKAQIRYFEQEESEKAWDWVSETAACQAGCGCDAGEV
jgi:hypothetical protein